MVSGRAPWSTRAHAPCAWAESTARLTSTDQCCRMLHVCDVAQALRVLARKRNAKTPSCASSQTKTRALRPRLTLLRLSPSRAPAQLRPRSPSCFASVVMNAPLRRESTVPSAAAAPPHPPVPRELVNRGRVMSAPPVTETAPSSLLRVASASSSQMPSSSSKPVAQTPAPRHRQVPAQLAPHAYLVHPNYVTVPQNPSQSTLVVPPRPVHTLQPPMCGAIHAYDAAVRQMDHATDRASPAIAVPKPRPTTFPSNQTNRIASHQPILHQPHVSQPSTTVQMHPQLNRSPTLPNPTAAVSSLAAASLPHTAVLMAPMRSQRQLIQPGLSPSSTACGPQNKHTSPTHNPPPKDPTIIHYYQRLDNTVQQAIEFSRNLRYPPECTPPDGSQIARVVAHDLQGVLGSEVDSLLAKHTSNKPYLHAFTSKVAGDFVEYGVSGTHLTLIADSLMPTETPVNVMQSPISPRETHSHPSVERARVRVFEAEITHLPLAFVEQLVKTRRYMRRFKSRIELHVRIILALEGKGRRVGDAQLDRLKLQLEKADQQAENERKRREAAEIAKLEKERRAKDTAKQSEKNGHKEKQLKKRRRQEHAQASFMKRFVKPRSEDHQGENVQEVCYVSRKRSGHYAQEIAEDPNVMSVDWWLRSEMQFVSIARLDELLKEAAGNLKSHLRDCASRREAAETRVNSVLHDYRAQRRVLCDDRYPRFTKKRAEVRGRKKLGAIKLLQFDENYRPAYYGTSRKSAVVTGRRPFKKDSEVDYDHDSEAEWEEDEGEDIQDVEDDKELASEEAELRKLYGSDDEDDDDFLDDAEAADDDDDDDEGDEGGEQNCDGDKKGKEGEVVDLTKDTRKEVQKARDSARVKRRKLCIGSVVIEGVSFSGASKLDAFPVSTFGDSKAIQMFNPFVFAASDIVSEHLKAKVPSTRPAKPSNMDEKAKLDLAVVLVNDSSNRERIVSQFCERRRTRGLNVPAKSEVIRAISEMATREKRDGDVRAVWHLNDAKLERMVQQMGPSGSMPETVVVTRPITTRVSEMMK
eukprot:TRINITY_DN4724_c0_g1_i1.p1 TRINITY_DN4724_c0_g1~~TRINITY_DN4724_c0_g1_i1.p1  ORF type:complete len:1034 (-),score=211.32 TRINITY_DN4724_c0_g1_i1:130-3231(-)